MIRVVADEDHSLDPLIDISADFYLIRYENCERFSYKIANNNVVVKNYLAKPCLCATFLFTNLTRQWSHRVLLCALKTLKTNVGYGSA